MQSFFLLLGCGGDEIRIAEQDRKISCFCSDAKLETCDSIPETQDFAGYFRLLNAERFGRKSLLEKCDNLSTLRVHSCSAHFG